MIETCLYKIDETHKINNHCVISHLNLSSVNCRHIFNHVTEFTNFMFENRNRIIYDFEVKCDAVTKHKVKLMAI